jgi:hypothetical protein
MKSGDRSTNRIRSDMVEEALRTAEEAESEDLTLRLLGGVAIRLRAKDGLHPAFEREYADLDWIVPKGTSSEAQRFFDSIGYTPHVRFNAIHGRERLLFFDEENDRQVDVLVGSFRMSHQIPFGDRLALEPVTVPLAELLLTKLQVVQLNEKDVRDALALLHDHPVEESDGDAINAAQVARLCASDWARRPPRPLRAARGEQRPHRRAHRRIAGAHRTGTQTAGLEDAGQDRGPQTLVRAARRGGGRTLK